MIDVNHLDGYLNSLEFSDGDRQMRLLAILSAVIAAGDYQITLKMISLLKKMGLGKVGIYEAIIQSYLFLGFPRMIEAGLAYSEVFGETKSFAKIDKISPAEAEKWFNEGMKLCKKVYNKNYEKLRDRFTAVSPEMFRWMIIEGYGKVLSRPGLNNIERELSEVAALIVDMRERQLVSHILGSLNVGADIRLLRRINEDIRPISGDRAYALADAMINKIEEKYEAKK
jgi:alkylhydroperoxidase/carboxymuconolactone decarboxylase family protein YurZ